MNEDKEMQSKEIDKKEKDNKVSFIDIDKLDVKTLKVFKELFSQDIAQIQKSFEQYNTDVNAIMTLYKYWSQARTAMDDKVTLLDTSIKNMNHQVENFKLFNEKMISWRKRLKWSWYKAVGVFCLASVIGSMGGGLVVDHFWSTHEPMQQSQKIKELDKKIQEANALKASYRSALIDQYKANEFAALPRNEYECTLIEVVKFTETQDGNLCTFPGWWKGKRELIFRG